MEILNQLGGLVLGSVPTAILFILLVIAYGFLVRRPLERTLAERRARTFGAVEQARGAISAAEAETTAYEEKLRGARAEIMAIREQQLKRLEEERQAALASAREQAQERVRAARSEIERSTATAREQIERAAAQLSEQIVNALLPKGAPLAEARQ
ncbi:MAG TPA: ATP synthase F0 subunit B [Acidobacteriaceae bacterium]